MYFYRVTETQKYWKESVDYQKSWALLLGSYLL